MSANPRSRPPAPSSPLREMPETKVDLSRMRLELRTPINHILGYCELLLEEDRLPETHRADLRRNPCRRTGTPSVDRALLR
jgi:signal transduction histidine kinase